MSVIRLISSPDSAATPYPPTQAGLDAAIAASNAAGGGIIEMSTGLESLAIAGIGSGTVVIRWRATTPLAMELFGANFILDNGQSYRIKDSGGTNRTVLRVSGDFTDLAAVGANGLRFTKNDGTVWLGPVTGTRFALISGQDLAPNNLPGSAGQFLTSQGAGASPTWTTAIGQPGFSTFNFLPTIFWANSVSTSGTAGEYVYSSMSAASDNANHATFRVPLNYTATTNWKLWFTCTTSGGGNAVYEFGMLKITGNGFDFTAASYTVGAKQTIAVAAADVLNVFTMPTPALSLAAGDVLALRIKRYGTDVSDTAANTNFLGMEFNYT